jgi:alanine racemase
MQSVHVQLILKVDDGLDRTGAEVMEWVKSLIFTLSSSSFRPFRYSATLAALSVNSSLIYIASLLEKDSTRLKVKLNSATNRVGRSNQETLQEQLTQLLKNKEIIDEQIMEFVNGYIRKYCLV